MSKTAKKAKEPGSGGVGVRFSEILRILLNTRNSSDGVSESGSSMLHCPACGHNFKPGSPPSIAGRVSRYVPQKQEATPSRVVRSCRTARLPSAAGAAQMSPNTGGGPDATAHRRRILGSPVEPHSFYKSLRQEEAALDLDRLHVLKIRNREAEGGAMTKDKFSKYSPLPDISRPHGRPFLRQKTYDVLEPVYVKGPPSPRHATKDKPPPRTSERGKTATVSSRVATKDSQPVKDSHTAKDSHPAKDSLVAKDSHPAKDSLVAKDSHPAKDSLVAKDSHKAKDSHAAKDSHPVKDSHTAKDSHPTKDSHATKDSIPTVKDTSNPLSNRRAMKLPHLAAQAPVAVPAKRPPLRRTSQFRPQELSKDILPQSPTAFWFPI